MNVTDKMGIEEIEQEVENCYQRLSHLYYRPCDGLFEEVNINEEFEGYSDRVDKTVNELIESENYMQAFVLIQKNLQLLNILQTGKSKIVSSLEKWAQKLYQMLDSVRQKLNAKGFTVSFSIPFGVTVQLIF